MTNKPFQRRTLNAVKLIVFNTAYSGQKTADEIIAFINSGDEEEKPKRPVKRTYKKR